MRIAALVVLGLALHVALGLLVRHHGPLGVDRTAFDVIDGLRGGVGLRAVRVFTDIGSLPVLVLVAGLGAARARDRADAIALVAGAVAVWLLVTIAKQAWDRPRPSDRYYDPLGASYPSGHSAYAIAWIAAARTTGGRASIVAATAVAIAIGASRLYLHVHYLTDVLGGFALGAAVFAPVLSRTR
jgi:membrane-associated phospholipid phosphatase